MDLYFRIVWDNLVDDKGKNIVGLCNWWHADSLMYRENRLPELKHATMLEF